MELNSDEAHWFHWAGEDLYLQLRVLPRAKRDALETPLGDALKVRITAPPVEGKANAHLRRFLAKQFGVSQSAVLLLGGERNRIKRVRIQRPKRLPESIRNAQLTSAPP